MDALTLLDAARAAGLKITAEGDKLVMKGPKSAEPFALQLGDRKPEVMAILRGQREVISGEPEVDSVPCPVCGSTLAWWTLPGVQRCLRCQPPTTALQWLDRAHRIRQRLGLKHERAEQLRHDLRTLIGA